jgi:hypothetical protein
MRIDGDEPETVDLARLLRIFSRTETGTTGAAKRIYRWEQYPVQVYLPQFVYEGSSGDLVDYRAIFLEGLDAWNRAAGEAMFELAEEEVELGVSYSATLAGPSAPLGEVVIVDPPNGSLFFAPPRQMLVRLRKFNTIHVARRVITHELGHLLLLGHSPDLEHCMNASAPNDTPTDLEGYVATLLAVMPQGLDMNFYREE